MCLHDIDVAILCGGKGTRIASVLGDIPKALAPVSGRPVLDWIIDKLKQHGARRVVLCTGHLSDKIGQWAWTASGRNPDIKIILSHEPEQRGTGQALQLASMVLKSSPFLLMNGDTLLDADYCKFVEHHHRYGQPTSVLLGKNKLHVGSGYHNTGHYLISQASLREFNEIPRANTDNLLRRQAWGLGEHRMVGAHFLDIGTPQGLEAAPAFLSALTADAA